MRDKSDIMQATMNHWHKNKCYLQKKDNQVANFID